MHKHASRMFSDPLLTVQHKSARISSPPKLIIHIRTDSVRKLIAEVPVPDRKYQPTSRGSAQNSPNQSRAIIKRDASPNLSTRRASCNQQPRQASGRKADPADKLLQEASTPNQDGARPRTPGSITKKQQSREARPFSSAAGKARKRPDTQKENLNELDYLKHIVLHTSRKSSADRVQKSPPAQHRVRPYSSKERAGIDRAAKRAIKKELLKVDPKRGDVDSPNQGSSNADGGSARAHASAFGQRRNSLAFPAAAGTGATPTATGQNSKNSGVVQVGAVLVTPQNPSSPITVTMTDAITEERERLIRANIRYIEKYKEIPKTTTEYYKLVKEIGKGSFGRVTLCVHKLTGKQVAIKSIDKACMKDEHSRKKILREVYILKTIKHANIIRLMEVFESEHHVHIVMENADGGDLLQYVKQRRKLREEEAKEVFRQIVYGLGHVHARSVLHRDIKLDNILLDADRSVKICDFGISKITDTSEKIKERCGTPAYLAPEIISNQEYSGFLSDHWSLGVLLYAMLFGVMPFKAPTLKDLATVIQRGNYTFPTSNVSEDAKDVIKGLMRLVPEERLTIPQILAHPWMRRADELPEKDEMGDADDQWDQGQAPDVNRLKIKNLYAGKAARLSYEDYCYIANDFYTQHVDEEALRTLEGFGYPKETVIRCLQKGTLNHAVASYNLLTL